MSSDNVQETPKVSDRTATRRSVPKLSPHRALLAEQRRAAFLSFLDERDLKPASLARLAGLASANAIYNFVKGTSASLSQTTIERILAAMPGATLVDLMGPSQPGRATDTNPASPALPAADSDPLRSASASLVGQTGRDDVALDVTFELQPFIDAITSLGVAVTGAERAVLAVRRSDPVVDVQQSWGSHNTLVRECVRLVEQRATALVESVHRLLQAR